VVALRWLLGVTTGLLLVAWILLVIASHDFRRSAGASPVSPFLPILPGVVLVLILATILVPDQRGLLTVTAVVVALAIIGSFFILRQSLATGVFAILYLASWLGFYWLATRGAVPR
jgi:L-asparagine transporter-like permease